MLRKEHPRFAVQTSGPAMCFQSPRLSPRPLTKGAWLRCCIASKSDGRFQLFEQALRRELVSRGDFDEALRTSGVRHLHQVEIALLETKGRISVVQKEAGAGDARAPARMARR